jgi:uncharacterized protein (TIGR02246 family)
MRLLLTIATCLTTVLSLAAQTAPRRGEDETAIRAVVSKYVDARQQSDARAIEALFTADADQLVSSGEWRKGREAVVRGTLASSKDTGGTRTITVESIRFISPDVAVADGRYEISGLSDGQTRRMWATFLFNRTPDGWRIAAIRNMLPAAPTPSARP